MLNAQNFSSPAPLLGSARASVRLFVLVAAAWFALSAGAGGSLRAQVPGGFDPAYTPSVLDQGAQVVAIQPVVVNGKTVYDTLLGGSFTTVNGASVNPLIRLNADGSLDTTFAASAGILVPREDADVDALLVQPDGKIVAAAYGTTTAAPTLTRLQADGTLDPTFTTTLPDGGVVAMALQPADGKIIIAGNFYTVDGTAVTGLTRLNPDGTVDASFQPAPAPTDASGTFLIQQGNAVLLQPDGKIVVSGTINTTAGVVYAIVRLFANGAQDPAFSPVLPNSGGSFQTLGLQADGSLVAAGNVSGVGGFTVPNIARFSGVDGTLDQTFAVGLTLGAGINQLAVQADGKILVSNNVGGGTTLTRLNADGSPDREYAAGFVVEESTATALTLQPDGLAVVSGTLILPNPQGNQPNVSVARLFASAASGLTTVSLTVPGTAKVWLAPNGAVDQQTYGDNLANAGPVRATGLALTPGTTLTFSATGFVDNVDGQGKAGPDGDGETETEPTQNGLSGITATGDALLGVFISDGAADPTNVNAPASLDFSGSTSGVSGGQDYTTLSPLLNQVFFIGDGKTSSGVTQQVTVPAGATHLAFGTVDYGIWHDNGGAFAVTITGTDAPPVGGPLVVPGTANPFLAGRPNGTVASANVDLAPAQSPVLVPNLTLDPNHGVLISVAGAVANSAGSAAGGTPDGGAFVTHNAENGLSTIIAPVNSLVGVFLGPDEPKFNGGPGPLDYSDPKLFGTGKTAYAPRLSQVFFIGNGLDASGRSQAFYPPQGATRLYLGAMDNTAYNDNTGAFNVGVSTSTVDASDLRVSQSVQSSSQPTGNGTFALEGDKLVYTYTVRNASAVAATNVVLTNILPGYLDPNTVTFFGGGGTYSNGIVTLPIGTLAAGASATRTVQFNIASAPLGRAFTNAGYYVTADGIANVPGTDAPAVFIEDAVSVKVSTNAASQRPGDSVSFTYDIANTTPTKFKKLTLTVPVPQGLLFGDVADDAYFVDSQGHRVTSTTNTVSFSTGGQITFTINALTNKSDVFAVVQFQVPYNFDPAGTIDVPGAQLVIAKYTAGNPVTFAVDGDLTPLSGQGPESLPSLLFGKSVPTGDQATALLTFEPKLGSALSATILQGYLAANPNQKFVTGLGHFTDFSALTPAQQTQVLNPYLGTDSDPDTDLAVSTLPAPTSQTTPPPPPFVTFALGFINYGAGKANAVTINDTIPSGLALVPDSILLNGAPVEPDALTVSGDSSSFSVISRNLKTGKGGVILYRANVLDPNAGGLAVGNFIQPTSAQLTIANLTSEIIAPPPGELLLTGPAHASVQSSQSGRTAIGSNVTYTLFYQNDGGQTITDLQVVSPVPAGGAFVSATLLDIDQQPRQPNAAKLESVDLTDTGAGGRVVFTWARSRRMASAWRRLSTR